MKLISKDVKTILVSGSRLWSSDEHIRIIHRELSKFPKDSTVIHGAAPGVDTIAHAIAEELGMSVKSYPADWKRYGHAAGFTRNRKMFFDSNPDIVLAFHDNIEESFGTKDMLELFLSQK